MSSHQEDLIPAAALYRLGLLRHAFGDACCYHAPRDRRLDAQSMSGLRKDIGTQFTFTLLYNDLPVSPATVARIALPMATAEGRSVAYNDLLKSHRSHTVSKVLAKALNRSLLTCANDAYGESIGDVRQLFTQPLADFVTGREQQSNSLGFYRSLNEVCDDAVRAVSKAMQPTLRANLAAKIGITCLSAHRNGDIVTTTNLARPDDVGLFATYGGRMVDDLAAQRDTLRRKGCKTIVITANDQLAAPAAGFDCAVVVPCRESMGGPDKVATFYSQTCIRYVLECIYGTVFARSYEKSRQHKSMAERELGQAG